jgi:hypothetical protein
MKVNSVAQASSQIIRIVVSIVLMVILVGYAAVTVLDEKVDSITPVVAFQFDTYCPINSPSKLAAIN